MSAALASASAARHSCGAGKPDRPYVANAIVSSATSAGAKGSSRTEAVPGAHVGDIAEALVAAHFGGERSSFSQKTWDVRTSTDLLRVKAIRRVTPAVGNLSPVRSEGGYDAVIAVIFTEDLRVERTLRIPRETINRLCRFNKHVNGRPIRLAAQLSDTALGN